jgi:HSP20 family protein
MSRLLDEFSRSLSAVGALTAPGLSPSIDVTETDKEIEITAELPGLERQDVEVSLEDNVLTIRGEKKMPADADDKNKNYHMSERSYGVCYRAFQLPVGIDPASVEATMANGVLKIKIPKPAHSEAKKIEVKEAA